MTLVKIDMHLNSKFKIVMVYSYTIIKKERFLSLGWNQTLHLLALSLSFHKLEVIIYNFGLRDFSSYTQLICLTVVLFG
jgi:hypothetical protein